MHNEFDNEEKYKLFRSVKELLHPTISKKNISNYKIIINEDVFPLRIFYPKKISSLKDVIIYVPGDGVITDCEGKYSDISLNLAKTLDRMVISIDYSEIDDLFNINSKVYFSIKTIYKELIKLGILKDNITFIGDSTGGSILLNFLSKMNKDKIEVGKMILFYPVLSGEYFGKTKYDSITLNNTINHDLVRKLKDYYSSKLKSDEYKSTEVFPLLSRKKLVFPDTLVLSGNTDPLVDEAKAYSEKHNLEFKIIGFAYHGFLNTNDKEIISEYTELIQEFIGNNNN